MSKHRKNKLKFKAIQSSLVKITHLAKEIVLLEDQEKDTSKPLDQLFYTVEWLVNKRASERIEDILYSDIGDREIEIIKFVIAETVYRLECPTDNGEGVTITPFAIPIAIVAPIEYRSKLESLASLPKIAIDTASTKLIRNGLNLGAEPTILLDNRLWRSDIQEWKQHNAVRNYLIGIAAYLSKISPVIPPLTPIKRTKIRVNNRHNENKFYLVTRSFTGAIISNNDEIDMALFGYNRVENLPDGVDPPELVFMNEFTLTCIHELESLGIKNANVLPISPWPLELWQVPEEALHFQRVLDIQQQATNAVEKLGGAPRNGSLEIVLLSDEENIMNIKLLAYEENASKPFFTYIWNIIHELEDPDTVTDDIIKIATDILKIRNFKVVKT